jgi:hypothetical protein
LAERRIHTILVTGLPGEDVIGVSALAVADLRLVGDVLANDRRVRRHGLVRVDDRGQLLVVDFDRIRAIRRTITVAGDHHRDLLQLKANLLAGEHRLHVAADRRHPVELDRLQIVGDEDRDDARHRERLGLVDRLDARMGIGTAHDRAEQHARQLDVVDIRALAADEAGILLAQSGDAQSLQLGLALEYFRCCGHREFSVESKFRCVPTTSCSPRIARP